MTARGAAAGTISQSSHEARSIRRWLHYWPGFGELDIHLERVKNLSRPALGLMEVSRPEPQNRGRIMQGSEAEWQIDVMGPDDQESNFWATRDITDSIQGALWQAKLIPLYYYDWRYPAVKSRYLGNQDLENVDVVTKVVGVAAVDPDGGVSLAGTSEVAIPQTLAEGDSIEVVWPQYPPGNGWAEFFWVYYGDTADEMTRWRIFPAEKTDWSRTTLVLDDGPDDNAAGEIAPTDSVIFGRRFMRLTSIRTRMLEHPDREGVWNGMVMFHTCCDVSRLEYPGLAVDEVPDLMRRIHSDVTVHG